LPVLTAMMSTSPAIRSEYSPTRALLIFSLRFSLTIFLGLISLFGAAQLRAQSDDSQQSSQGVAEAARQARARKQQGNKSNHVYTNEELRRAKILTPGDQARAAAKRKQPLNPATKENTEPFDANSAPAQEPLGDVARRYRNERRNAQKTSPFHLPSEQPELAAPRVITPLPAPMLKSILPARPGSPLNPNTTAIAPLQPSIPSHRVDPFARRRSQPAPQILPGAPRSVLQPDYSALAPRSVLPVRGSSRSIVVQQGDTLWTLSRRHLGRGTRWLEFMAANPSIADPTRLVPGASLVVPAKISHRNANSGKITVQQGDTLSRIAHATYGHASAWPCIAHANPALTNPDHLSIGQSLLLPASCTP
jgi:nucleoid-associated protein YgaU